jgi:hypothetical protein
VTLEFKDKLDRVVCKKVQVSDPLASQVSYASTYYIYDVTGHLVVVLPPEAIAHLGL